MTLHFPAPRSIIVFGIEQFGSANENIFAWAKVRHIVTSIVLGAAFSSAPNMFPLFVSAAFGSIYVCSWRSAMVAVLYR